MKTPTTASCFATYTLPHVLFVDDFEERRRIAMICCLAWNISLFPDARQREEHIEMTWNMGVNDNRPLPPLGGMEHGWKSEMGCWSRKSMTSSLGSCATFRRSSLWNRNRTMF